jgi:hypothetical protein
MDFCCYFLMNGTLHVTCFAYTYIHSWARNIKMLRRKSKTQLFKAHCAATINAKNVSFHPKKIEAQKMQPRLY